jgi:hypothetical protein
MAVLANGTGERGWGQNFNDSKANVVFFAYSCSMSFTLTHFTSAQRVQDKRDSYLKYTHNQNYTHVLHPPLSDALLIIFL